MNTPASLADHVEQLLAAEAQADLIRAWHPSLIPGLLQTEAYATAAIRGSAPALADEDVLELAAERTTRINVLGPGRRAVVILGLAALTRPVGGPHVLAAQLRQLLDLTAQQPSLTVRVMPSHRGEHPGLVGAFTLYSSPAGRTVHIEHLMGGTILDQPERVLAYTNACNHAESRALDPKTSRRLILDSRRRLAARR